MKARRKRKQETVEFVAAEVGSEPPAAWAPPEESEESPDTASGPDSGPPTVEQPMAEQAEAEGPPEAPPA
ncbi:MAG TPA: hypothetical protein VHF58_08570, partial [Solirubrobacterales bacterium]|nr:hypothetical protein [Solirubrobacterales bacterium]